MRDTEMAIRGRITVYGSHVARDSAAELERRGWTVERHVARQSLISAGRPAAAGDLDLSVLSSPFARRSFLSDMVGNLEAQLTAIAACTDLLLWDLGDERLGVLETAPEAFLTRSTEAMAAGLYQRITARLIEMGTAEHLHLWRPALLHFNALLNRLSLADKTVLIHAPRITRASSNHSMAPKPGGTMPEANWVMARYVDLVRQETDIRILQVPDEHMLTDDADQRDSAPLQYVDALHTWMADELEATRSLRSPAPSP